MDIQTNRVATIHYTLTDDDQNILDSSEGREALPFLVGAGNIIPGLEKGLIGKRAGDELTVVVEPAEGYGEHNPAMVQEAPRAAFEGVENIQPGMRFNAETDQGPIPVVIKEVKADTIVVDGNHPLAGVRLHFAVKVDSVRAATAEEIEHGHVHGVGGHQH